jgi:hypothetical protein
MLNGFLFLLAFSAAVISNNSGPSECSAYNFWCLKPGSECLSKIQQFLERVDQLSAKHLILLNYRSTFQGS